MRTQSLNSIGCGKTKKAGVNELAEVHEPYSSLSNMAPSKVYTPPLLQTNHNIRMANTEFDKVALHALE